MFVLTNLNITQEDKKRINKSDIKIERFKPKEADERLLEQAEGILINQSFANKNFLSACKNLKWIQLPSSGYEKVDMEYLKEKDIILTNAKGVYSIPIAEDVFCKILTLSRNYISYIENKKASLWKNVKGTVELCNKTIGILGTGSIGVEIAKRAKSFSMRTMGFNTSGRTVEYFDEIVTEESFDKIIAESDYIVLAIPATSKTHKLIDKRCFQIMKNTAFVINIARGDVIDEEELIKALKDNRIAGAALDVFTKEPLPEESEIWKLDNVIITPHQAGEGDYSIERMKQLFLDNLEQYPDIKKMQNVISND